jgi:hypothetical protein
VADELGLRGKARNSLDGWFSEAPLRRKQRIARQERAQTAGTVFEHDAVREPRDLFEPARTFTGGPARGRAVLDVAGKLQRQLAERQERVTGDGVRLAAAACDQQLRACDGHRGLGSISG